MSNPFALDTPAPAPATATVPTPTTAPNPLAGTPYAGVPATVAGIEGDPFDAPAAQQARGPRMREMYGRLLLVIPRKLEHGVVSRTLKNSDGSPAVQDRMTADVVILDGTTIHYGGKPEAVIPVPHDKSAEIPFRVTGMFISNAGLISQCREALAKIVSQGRPGMVLGRLGQGQGGQNGNPPWILTPATDADRVIGKAYLATVDPFAG
jgi:hypothetical protein